MSVKRYANMTLSIVMLLVLFLFVTMIDYITNLRELSAFTGESGAYSSAGAGSRAAKDGLRAAVTQANSSMGQVVRNYLQDVGIDCVEAENLRDIAAGQLDMVFCVDAPETVDEQTRMEELLDEGVDVVLLHLPEWELLQQGDYAADIGIEKMLSLVADQEGIRFVSGFMAGDMAEYLDLSYQAAEVVLREGTQTYSYVLTKENKQKGVQNELLPPVIWRYQNGAGAVYVVNTSLVEDNVFVVGIVSAMLSDMQPAFLYPTLNAYIMEIFNLPSDSYTNEEKMQRLYSRDGWDVQSEVLLPTIENLCRKYDVTPVLYTGAIKDTAHADYNADMFRNVIVRLGGQFVQDNKIDENPLPWDENTRDIFYTDVDMLRYRSLLTAYGVIDQKVDMAQILNPEEERYSWNVASLELESTTSLLRQLHPVLPSITLDEMNERLAVYYGETPVITYGVDIVFVHRETSETTLQFLLRTDKQIGEVNGGDAFLLENNIWMVCMKADVMQISLVMEENMTY